MEKKTQIKLSMFLIILSAIVLLGLLTYISFIGRIERESCNAYWVKQLEDHNVIYRESFVLFSNDTDLSTLNITDYEGRFTWK